MAVGTASGASCFSTQAEAALAACASLVGVGPGGAMSCGSVSSLPSTSVGGGVAVDYVLLTDTGSGLSSHASQMFLQSCETYGIDYWQPALGAWVAALIAIMAAKIVVRRLFSEREGF